MSDIFISYASVDRDRAKVFADLLAEQGWSVWWDRVIPPGRQFDEVIEEALDAAKVVVVLWSQASAASTWVKTEAAEAMRGKALIPAIIEEGVRIPLEFRRLQAADLSRWSGDRDDPQLQQFFQSIDAVAKRSPAPAPVPPSPSPQDAQHAPPPQPPRVDPTPPPRPVPPPAPQPHAKRKLSPGLIGAIVAAVIALLGAGLYYEHTKSAALAEQAERMKAEQERAERERADRERTERERVAREDRDRASRADEERRPRQQAPVASAREQPPREQQPRSQPARAAQPVPTTGAMSVRWRDHALGFDGRMSWNPSSAMLQVGVVDLQTGTPIGNYSVPAMVQQQGPREYIVSAQFNVPGDSTTRGAHTHTSRLLFQAQNDGSLRLVQNCPRPGECY